MCERHYDRWRYHTPRDQRPPLPFKTVHDTLADLSVQLPGEDGCRVWRSGSRYPWIEYRGRRYRASHLAWILHMGVDIPAGLHMLHRCDNPSCVRPEHLVPGTVLENSRDVLCRERWGRNVKLDWQKVRYIRQRRSMRATDLARELGVCRTTIRSVWECRTWIAECA